MTVKERKTILFVEDDGLVVLDKSQALKAFGYEVASVDSGEEAVEAAVRDQAISLVLMDLDLGDGLDGSEAARRILSQRKLPIVFFTSHSGPDFVNRVRNVEHYGYVLKNSGDSVLRDSLETAFRLFPAQEAAGLKDEGRYQRLLETMPEGFSLHEIILDKAGKVFDNRIIDCNAAYEKHTGVMRSEVVGKTMREINPSVDGTLIERFGRVALIGEPFYYEYESKTFGRFFHVCTFRPSPGHFACIFEDVTGFQDSETALCAAKDRIQHILSSIMDIYIFLDNDWIFLDLNPEAEAALRRKRSDLIGRKYWEVFPQALGSEVHKNLNVAMYERIPMHFEEYSKGAEKWAEMHVYPCEKGLECYIRDITERKETEKILRDCEEKYRALFENEFYAMSLADAETFEFLEVNKAFSVFYGYARDELLDGMTVFDISADKDETDRAISFTKAEGSIYVPLRYHRKKNGTVFPVDIVGGVFEWKGRKVMLGITHDISCRKEAEDRVAGLLEEKDLILREVHHRIKNNMVTMISLLSLQSARMKQPEAVEALLEAQNRLRSMSVLYDKLYNSDSLKNMSVRDYLEPLIDDVVKLFPASAKVKISKEIEDFLLGVKVLSSLGIIVNEFITNTMKYAFHGRNEGAIVVRLTRKNGMIRFVMQDDGVGLPETFDIANPACFGLKIVKAIVKQLKGSLQIEGTQGTRFVLDFPG